eukprot:m.258259 g.258259  ORF g.258259 m.258259 type:complete len:145 (-) comp15537_c0_seq1:34-468(-)
MRLASHSSTQLFSSRITTGPLARRRKDTQQEIPVALSSAGTHSCNPKLFPMNNLCIASLLLKVATGASDLCEQPWWCSELLCHSNMHDLHIKRLLTIRHIAEAASCMQAKTPSWRTICWVLWSFVMSSKGIWCVRECACHNHMP